MGTALRLDANDKSCWRQSPHVLLLHTILLHRWIEIYGIVWI